MANLFFQNGAGSPADGSITRAKLAQGAVAQIGVTLVAAGFTATTNNDYVGMTLGGASFSVNLPLAATCPGKRFWFTKRDSSINFGTLKLDGNDQFANGTTYTTLAQQNETISVISNGSSLWIIDSRWYPTNLASVNLTLTGLGTVANANYRVARLGRYAKFTGHFTSGTVGATPLTITLPSPYVIDASQLPTRANIYSVGMINRIDSASAWATTSAGPFVLFYDGSNTTTIFYGNSSASDTEINKSLGTNFGANGDSGTFEFMVPIKDWG